MKSSPQPAFKKKNLLYILCLGIASLQPAQAQVIPDAASPTGTFVTQPDPNLPSFEIGGGELVDGNLFHRFLEFSIVPINGVETVEFTNLNADNIFSLISGNSVSVIDGILRAGGGANFFLINPNGVVFGPNAALDVSGSFIASTASSVVFAAGEQFDATTTPSDNPLLTLNAPLGLQFGSSAGSIINNSQASLNGAVNSLGGPAGLRVPIGQTLALLGNQVSFDNGNLTAQAGRAEVGSVAPGSFLALNSIQQGWAVDYGAVTDFRDISFVQGSVIDTSGPQGGSQVRGRNIRLESGAQINNLTFGLVGSGAVDINASGSLLVAGTSNQGLQPSGIFTFTVPGSTTPGGDLTINADNLIVRDGGQISTATLGSGASGALTITTHTSVDVIGTGPAFSSVIETSSFGSGQGGDLTIKTGTLRILEGGLVNALTAISGQGGNITINASNQVEVSGTGRSVVSPDPLASGIVVSSGFAGFPFLASGNGGNIAINAPLVQIQNGGRVSAESLGTGAAGGLTFNADSVVLDNQAQIAVNSTGTGRAGTLEVNADFLSLARQSQITAAAAAANGGNVQLNVSDLILLQDNSLISATAGDVTGFGDGGNITIDTGFLVAVPNQDSDIIANAFAGQGGNIQISALGVFYIEPRPAVIGNGTNDIDASSEFGLDGVVRFEILDAPLEQELTALSEEILDPSSLVVQTCGVRGEYAASSFVISGREGLPPTPYGAIGEGTALVDLGETESAASDLPESLSMAAEMPPPTSRPIVEAQGFVLDPQGNVLIAARVPDATLVHSGLASPSCRQVN